MSEKSKLNIVINDDYRITSDGLNIIVNERRFTDPTKAPGWAKRAKEGADPTPRETWKEISWHGTIEQALKSVINRNIKLSNAQTVSELLEEIRELKTQINRVLDA